MALSTGYINDQLRNDIFKVLTVQMQHGEWTVEIDGEEVLVRIDEDSHRVLAVRFIKLMPLEIDETPGMPRFEVDGILDNGTPVKGTVSIEFDGRDLDWN